LVLILLLSAKSINSTVRNNDNIRKLELAVPDGGSGTSSDVSTCHEYCEDNDCSGPDATDCKNYILEKT
jgi:hypothetical protein